MTRFHPSCRTGGVRVHPSLLAALAMKELPLLHFAEDEALYCPSELFAANPTDADLLHSRGTHVVVR